MVIKYLLLECWVSISTLFLRQLYMALYNLRSAFGWFWVTDKLSEQSMARSGDVQLYVSTGTEHYVRRMTSKGIYLI